MRLLVLAPLLKAAPSLQLLHMPRCSWNSVHIEDSGTPPVLDGLHAVQQCMSAGCNYDVAVQTGLASRDGGGGRYLSPKGAFCTHAVPYVIRPWLSVL